MNNYSNKKETHRGYILIYETMCVGDLTRYTNPKGEVLLSLDSWDNIKEEIDKK